MDRYRFKCGGVAHDVELSKFDSALLSGVRRYAHPAWRSGIFAAVRADESVYRPRAAALQDARVLLQHLEAEKALLPYDYSIRLVRAGTAGARTVRNTDLSFNGRRATATASAGLASVEVYSLQRIDGETADALVARGEMWPHEADVFHKWSMEVSMVEQLHDLRDLKPFVTDEGHTLQAVRKPHPTNLLTIVGSIVDFIAAHECDQVEVAFLGEPPWG